MDRRLTMFVMGFAALGAGYVMSGQWVSAQQSPASIAAVPGEKGGQDIYGPYEPVVGWPKDISTIPGNEGWTFGAGQSVFAETPDRIYVVQRGELPAIKRPTVQKLAPSISFPIGRLPWRDATTASPPGNGGTGQLAEEGMDAWAKAGNKMGVDAKWEHCVMVFDGQGNLLPESANWMQYDASLQRPHFIAISPYDAEKNVWLIDDHKHVVYKMTHDGKTKLMTLGTYGVPGADDTHFNRPTYMDWFPDGSFVVADGYNGTRIVKFDKTGKFMTAWGEKGMNNNDTRPGFFNNVHGIAVDPKTLRVFVNDRGNHRAQVFDQNGKFLDQWSFGPNPSDVHMFNITADGYLWAADRGTNKIVKYDLNGRFLYSWGMWGERPGGMWGVHGMASDTDGNVYVAEVDNGGVQKFKPRAGANPAYLMGKPIRSAWK